MGAERVVPLVVWVGRMISFFDDNFVLACGGRNAVGQGGSTYYSSCDYQEG